MLFFWIICHGQVCLNKYFVSLFILMLTTETNSLVKLPVAMAKKHISFPISSHIWKLIMQFGLCISQDCSYVSCPLWKNIAQTAKKTHFWWRHSKVERNRGHVTNLQWPYNLKHMSGCVITFCQILRFYHGRHNLAKLCAYQLDHNRYDLNIAKIDIIELLEIATKNQLFQFQGNLCLWQYDWTGTYRWLSRARTPGEKCLATNHRDWTGLPWALPPDH